MALVIMCLAALFFMVWVVLLKFEIEELKRTQRRPDSKSRQNPALQGTVSGMKRYSIGRTEGK